MSIETQHEIERLNADCTCITLDREQLCKAFEQVVGDPAFCHDLAVTHPYLLSAQPMFLSAAHAERMQEIISSVEAVASRPSYQSAVFEHAPEIARFQPGPIGVFMGYDFHLERDGPRLIEINTNAGGALINAYLLQAQRVCCSDMAVGAAMHFDLRALLDKFMSNFEMEWRRQGRAAPLRSIAIVDQSPVRQYLYPEFVLFQRLFEAHGIAAVIAAPEDLSHCDNALWCGEKRIDLVYNRLTDFYFEQPESKMLRAAYLAGEVLVTPSPRVHALVANKQNLTLLTDENTLRKWGVADGVISTLLRGIPKTVLLTPNNANACWTRRNQLFFKPSAGFGGKAAYRGDKITRKVWSDILSAPAPYVAQEIVPPSARTIAIDGALQTMKADLRSYTYDGKMELVAARLYQGQTTNLRTPGGGFAPVFIGDGAPAKSCR
jgi:hypothetical protein